jgi:hypothetical protein
MKEPSQQRRDSEGRVRGIMFVRGPDYRAVLQLLLSLADPTWTERHPWLSKLTSCQCKGIS